MLVVFLNNGLFVFLIFGGDKLLGTEEIDDMIIIRLLHRLIDLHIGQSLITGDVYLTHFRLRLLIYTHQHANISRMVRIVTLDDLHIGIMESFLRQVFLNHRLGVVLHIGCHLTSLTNTGFHFHIFPLTFLQSFISDFADTGTLFQSNNQPDLISLYLTGFDLYG